MMLLNCGVHLVCRLLLGVQTCALPILEQEQDEVENQVLLHLGKTLQERDAKRTESRNG